MTRTARYCGEHDAYIHDLEEACDVCGRNENEPCRPACARRHRLLELNHEVRL